MRMLRYKTIPRLLAACLCMLMLAGCAIAPEYPPGLAPSEATPPPLTDERAGFLATLYFYSADGQLGTEQRMVDWPTGVSRAQVALQALCDGPSASGLSPVIPAGLRFDRVELLGNVCDVYFNGILPEGSQPLLVARAAIAATVRANEGIGYTDVLINGVQPGLNGRPLGVLKPIEVSLSAYLSEYLTTDVETGAEAGTLESKDAQLYFLDTSGKLLLSGVSRLRYDRGAEAEVVISALLGELLKGPLGIEGREPVLPTDMQLKKCIIGQPDKAGEEKADDQPMPDVAELYFTRPAAEFDERMVYASIVYSVTGFWPGLKGVRIYLDEEPVLPDAALYTSLGQDIFSRAHFAGVLGHTATLAFPDQEGLGLYPVMRCMGQDTVYDPLERLRALFAGSADLGVSLNMFRHEDVLMVSVQGNMAVVNWRKGFVDTLSDFVEEGVSHLPKSARSRMVLFAMVNTLCNIPGVQRVWMLEDGQRIDNSIGNVYLGNALLYNPGLMLS